MAIRAFDPRDNLRKMTYAETRVESKQLNDLEHRVGKFSASVDTRFRKHTDELIREIKKLMQGHMEAILRNLETAGVLPLSAEKKLFREGSEVLDDMSESKVQSIRSNVSQTVVTTTHDFLCPNSNEVRMSLFEEILPTGEKLSEIINQTNENVNNLPGIKLGKNVVADPDLENAVRDATMLVCVTPHQLMEGNCRRIVGKIRGDAEAISLIKEMEVTKEGPCMISSLVSDQLGINCCVLMDANIANEIAVEKFSEPTVGYRKNKEMADKWVQLFNTSYFMVQGVDELRDIPTIDIGDKSSFLTRRQALGEGKLRNKILAKSSSYVYLVIKKGMAKDQLNDLIKQPEQLLPPPEPPPYNDYKLPLLRVLDGSQVSGRNANKVVLYDDVFMKQLQEFFLLYVDLK